MKYLQSRCEECNVTVLASEFEFRCPNCGQDMILTRRRVNSDLRRNPIYRRNSDDSLREAERQFQLHPGWETFDEINRLRERMGLDKLPDIRTKLEFGLRHAIPFGVEAAWGCRAILNNYGVDMVYQSTAGTDQNKQPLVEALNGGLIRDLREEAMRLVRLYVLNPDEDLTHWLAENERFIVLGNTNASYGHFYLVAFEKPKGWVGPKRYEEPPPPPPPPPMAPYHAQRTYNIVIGYGNKPETLTPDDVNGLMRTAKELLTAKSGAKTLKSFFRWLVQQGIQPETLAAIQAKLKEEKIKLH